MSCKLYSLFFLVVLLCGIGRKVNAQNPIDRLKGLGSMRVSNTGNDSLIHRTGYEDSLTISFRYLDSSRYRRFDSSITDFGKHFPLPADYIFLGNTGSAAHSILFQPILRPGWDPGFHAYDVYQATVAETRFYNTTRPYSELGYLIGSRTEQLIKLLHTQNINPNWNAAFQYNLINSPGLFKNQNTNHNTIRFNTSFQTKDKRYHAFFVLINNKIQAGENGGIKDDENYLDNLITYADRSLIPVQLGNTAGNLRSVFSTSVATGTKYRSLNLLFRQQYDLGKKDSLVLDSSIVRLFYPKLRIEHTIHIGSSTYSFVDQPTGGDVPDTIFYKRYYDFAESPSSVLIKDQWNEITNDLSIYQFPDSKNPQQFFKGGAALQNLKGSFDSSINKYTNFFVHAEYRNKTRNQKWDIEGSGELYISGLNSGDYSGLISLKRFVGKQMGYLQAGFQNVNRTPSFVFDNASSFSLTSMPAFNKENITTIFASLEQPKYRLKLTGRYYLLSNYAYFSDYYHADQASQLFNILQVTAQKGISIGKRWHWDAELTLQQKAGSAPVNLPLFYTRNLIYYQGNLGFKNLLFLFGTEVKYHTPYKANGYSPLTGQFFYQNDQTLRLKAPNIAGFVHFRIKTFTSYIRAENLNTISLRNGFGFTNNNLAAINYPYQGLQIRVGILWAFVN